MKKYAIAFACILLVALTAVVISDTTFSWSEPGQKGTLTYTAVGLTDPVLNAGGVDADDIAVADGKIIIGGAAGTGAEKTIGGDITIANTGVGAIVGGVIVNADVNAGADIALTKLASAGLGSAVDAKTSRTEAQSDYVITVIDLTNVVLIATDTSDEGESQKIFDADKGAFLVSLSVANMSCVTTAGATNTFYMGCGSAAAGDDSDLTGTEVDVIPRITIDTTAGAVLTNAFDGVLAAAAVFDGTGTAKDIYLNWAIADADMDANVTNTITGTLTIITTKVVDH